MFCSLRTPVFQQRGKMPLHPHCPTYSSLWALKHSSHWKLQEGEETHSTVSLMAVETKSQNEKQGELEEHERIFLIWCLVWALSPHGTELQFLCSPEVGSSSLQTVPPGKSATNANMFLLITRNQVFSKTSHLARPRCEGHLLSNVMWVLQSLGVLEQLKENVFFFFLLWLAIFLLFSFKNSWIVGWHFPKSLSAHQTWETADCMVRAGKVINN